MRGFGALYALKIRPVWASSSSHRHPKGAKSRDNGMVARLRSERGRGAFRIGTGVAAGWGHEVARGR